MTIENVIDEIKIKYAEDDNFDEIINDLEGGTYYEHWANKIIEDEGLENNKELAKELYTLAIDKCETSYECRNLAESFIKYFNDKTTARELYEKSAVLAECSNDYSNLATSIASADYLDDKNYSKAFYEKALELSEEIYQLSSVAEEISTVYMDKEWARIVYKAIEDKIENLDHTNTLIEATLNILKDKEWSLRLIQTAIHHLKSADDMYAFAGEIGEIKRLADFIADEDTINDKKLAKEVYDLFKINTTLSGYFKLTIMSAGGEYGYGVIEDEYKINLLRKMIDEGELGLDNEDADTRVDFYECDTQLLHNYGPGQSDAVVSINVYEDEECTQELEEIVNAEDIAFVDLNLFTLENPYLTEEMKEEFSEDALVFGGYYIEKRIHLPAVIHIDSDETFEINNVYVGTVNMDETLSADEIVSRVLYIRPKVSQQIMDIYLNGENSNDPLSDYIQDIYSEITDGEHSEIAELLQKCECEILDIEGKGEREESFAIVRTLDDEILFEGDC